MFRKLLFLSFIIFCSPSFAQRYSNIILSDSPVAYYRLGDSGTTAKDEVGITASTPNGRNALTYQKVGTLSSGGYTVGQLGALVGDSNTSVRFDRDTSVNYPSAYGRTFADTTTGLPSGNSSFSLEAWIFSEFQGDGNFIANPNILAYGVNSTNQKNGIQLLKGNGQSYVGQYFFGNDYLFPVTDLTGSWHHVVSTYTGAGAQTLSLYIDGSLAGTRTVSGTPNIQQGNLEIGVLSPFVQNSFKGRIDEVAIYRTALSADRVSAHYHSGTVPSPSALLTAIIGIVPGALLLRRRRK